MDIVIGLIAFVGFASGLAFFIGLRRLPPQSKPQHVCEECPECQTGFLCPTALSLPPTSDKVPAPVS